MDIQAEKIELLKMVLNTTNPKIIQSIRQIFKKEQVVDFWDEMTPNQQAEIKVGLSQIKKGKVKDYESFIANHK